MSVNERSREGQGKYADTLAALGQFLHPFRASDVEIVDRGDRLHVWWRSADDPRSDKQFHTFGVNALRAFGGSIRTPRRSSGTAELLRALGRELDEMQAESLSLLETADGFRVRARVGGADFEHTYTRTGLRARAGDDDHSL